MVRYHSFRVILSPLPEQALEVEVAMEVVAALTRKALEVELAMEVVAALTRKALAIQRVQASACPRIAGRAMQETSVVVKASATFCRPFLSPSLWTKRTVH